MSTTYCEVGNLGDVLWRLKVRDNGTVDFHPSPPSDPLDRASIVEAATTLHRESRLHSMTAVQGLYTVCRSRGEPQQRSRSHHEKQTTR